MKSMPDIKALRSKLPSTGVSIFAVMSKLATEHGAINLSQGFPDFDCSPDLVDTVARHMRAGQNQYAPMPGVFALRTALAEKIQQLYGRRYDPATEITITAGATEALYSTLTALVHGGDEVILFQPAYDSYLPAVELSGGVPRLITLRPPDYRIDWDEVRHAVSARTRVIVINTPHNPTGTILDRDDVRGLTRALERTDAVVVADEVYEHIVFDGARHESLARYPELAERAVVISSFGKTYHTTGWKVGYAAAPQRLSVEIQRVHQFVAFAVNTPVQHAYAEFVARDPLCTSLAPFYQQKRDAFLSLIRKSRFKPLACRGTYFQMLDYSAITEEPDEAFALRLIRDHGVAAIPVSPFLQGADPGPVLRFCFAKRDETLEFAAERLCRV
ncbi:MAG: methionine aminotransferase [Vicinamibacterales bacterium]